VNSAYQQTVGSRAFPVTGPQTWNDLPEDVTSAESLATFRHLLKTNLFRKSFLTTCWTSTDCLQYHNWPLVFWLHAYWRRRETRKSAIFATFGPPWH